MAVAPDFAGTYLALSEDGTVTTAGCIRVVLSQTGSGSLSMIFSGLRKQRAVIVRDQESGMFAVQGKPEMKLQVRVRTWGETPEHYLELSGEHRGEEFYATAYKIAAAEALAQQPQLAGKFVSQLCETNSFFPDYACGPVRIGSNGAVRGTLRLLTGEVASFGSNLSAYGSWPLFATARSGVAITGEVGYNESLANGSFDEMGGTGRASRWWDSVPSVEGGWTLTFRGERFAGSLPLGPGDSHGTVRVEVFGYVYDEETGSWSEDDFADSQASVSQSGYFFHGRKNLRMLPIRYSPLTGMISGSIKTSGGKTHRIFGAHMPISSMAGGFFVGGAGEGAFEIFVPSSSEE
jgi:hypothetical protein